MGFAPWVFLHDNVDNPAIYVRIKDQRTFRMPSMRFLPGIGLLSARKRLLSTYVLFGSSVSLEICGGSQQYLLLNFFLVNLIKHAIISGEEVPVL